jgi:hypothetical protein
MNQRSRSCGGRRLAVEVEPPLLMRMSEPPYLHRRLSIERDSVGAKATSRPRAADENPAEFLEGEADRQRSRGRRAVH